MRWSRVGVALTCVVREEHEPEFAQLVHDYLKRRPAHCVAREVYTSVREPRCYRLVERWSARDRTHLEQHLFSDEHRALVGGLRALGTLDVEESVCVPESVDDDHVRYATLVMRDLEVPVAALAGIVDRVRTELATGEVAAASADCAELEHGVADVLALLRIGSSSVNVVRVETRVQELLRSVTRALMHVARARGVALETDAGSVVAWLDLSLVTQMLHDLVGESLGCAVSGDRVQLAAWSAGDDLCLAVRSTAAAPLRLDVRTYLCAAASKALGGSLEQVVRAGWTTSLEVRLPRGENAGRHP